MLDLTLAEFLTFFPEFQPTGTPSEISERESEITKEINQTQLMVNDYNGIPDKKRRRLAVYLHVAHLLTFKDKEKSGEIAPKQELKSRYDEVKFALDEDQKGFGLEATTYGYKLKQILDSAITYGGFF
jgi:hypothetical protein